MSYHELLSYFCIDQQSVGIYGKMLFVSVTVKASVPLRRTVPRLKRQDLRAGLVFSVDVKPNYE